MDWYDDKWMYYDADNIYYDDDHVYLLDDADYDDHMDYYDEGACDDYDFQDPYHDVNRSWDLLPPSLHPPNDAINHLRNLTVDLEVLQGSYRGEDVLKEQASHVARLISELRRFVNIHAVSIWWKDLGFVVGHLIAVVIHQLDGPERDLLDVDESARSLINTVLDAYRKDPAHSKRVPLSNDVILTRPKSKNLGSSVSSSAEVDHPRSSVAGASSTEEAKDLCVREVAVRRRTEEGTGLVMRGPYGKCNIWLPDWWFAGSYYQLYDDVDQEADEQVVEDKYYEKQAESLLPSNPAQKEVLPERRRLYPIPRAPVPLDGTTGLPAKLATTMSSLAFSAGPKGRGALPVYEEAQACLLIAAEDAGVTLPTHALLTAGDWTIVVHYALESEIIRKILQKIPSRYPGARISTSSLSTLIAELPTISWKVGTCIAAAREAERAKTVSSEITLADRKALAGEINRLVDEAAASLPTGNMFVENYFADFWKAHPHAAHEKVGSDVCQVAAVSSCATSQSAATQKTPKYPATRDTPQPASVPKSEDPHAAPQSSLIPEEKDPDSSPKAPVDTPQALPDPPQAPAEAPQAPADSPQAIADPLQAPAEPPLAPPDAPQAPADAPQAPADAPQAPADAPQAPADAPQAPADAPQAPADAPQAPAVAPQAPADAPQAPADAPRAPADAPKAPAEPPQDAFDPLKAAADPPQALPTH